MSDLSGSFIQGGAVGIRSLASALNGSGDRDVVDRTGLTVFTAVQEQLGLKLEADRAPVEFLVIERIERPTPD